jgi:HAD superfamily hydrolase (TIGR01509 family)
MPETLVIFDCDGVLIDSEMLACAVQARVFTEAGYPIDSEGVLRRFVGRSASDMREAVEAELGRPLPEDYPSRCAAAMEAAFREGLLPVAGMADLVRRLKHAGHAMCVASSSSPERLALTLGLTGLRALFDPHVFSATMVARGKPAPDLFLHAAACMKVAPQTCLVVEDSPAGVEAARAAGMTAFGFTAASHGGAELADRLRAAGAGLVLADAPALQHALLAALAGRHTFVTSEIHM